MLKDSSKIQKNTIYFRVCLLLSLWLFGLCGYIVAEDTEEAGKDLLKRTTNLVGGCGCRYEGASGNKAVCDKVNAHFKANSDYNGYTQYESPVFVAGETWISVAGKKIRMYSLLPNAGDLCNFRNKEFTANIHYVGKGDLPKLNGIDFKNSIVIFDFNCGINYLSVIKRGALGCVFIEPDLYSPSMAYEKILHVPLSIPRYQISRDDGQYLKNICKGKKETTCRVIAKPNRYVTKVMRNYWALVEGNDTELKKEIVILYANIDGINYCPELTGAGSEAVNLQLLLDKLEFYKKNPPKRSILFLAFNSHHQYNSGAAEMLFHLFGPKDEILEIGKSSSSEKKVIDRELKEYEYVLKRYAELAPSVINQQAIDNIVNSLDEQPGGRQFAASTPILDMLQRKRHELEMERGRLVKANTYTPENEKSIKAAIHMVGQAVSLFNSFRSKVEYASLTREEKGVFETYRLKVVELAKKRVARAKIQLRRLDNIAKTRKFFKKKELRPIYAMGLKMNYNNRFISMNNGLYRIYDDFGDGPLPNKELGKISKGIGNGFINRVSALCDKLSTQSYITWASSGGAKLLYKDSPSFTSVQFILQKIPAFEFRTPYDLSPSMMSSNDIIENLSPATVGAKSKYISNLISSIIDDQLIVDAIAVKDSSKRNIPKLSKTYGCSAEVVARLQDGSSITEPKTILDNAVVVFPLIRKGTNSAYRGGMMSYRLVSTDCAGRGLVYNLPRGRPYQTNVYKYNNGWQIAYYTEMASSKKKYSSVYKSETGFREHLLFPAFKCQKADLYDICHPKKLTALRQPSFIAASGKNIKWYGYNLGFEAGAFFLPTGVRSCILFENNVNLINASEKYHEGTGYLAKELDRKSFIELAMHDVVRLNDGRIKILTDNAVRDELMSRVHNNSIEWLGSAPKEPNAMPTESPTAYDARLSRSIKTFGSGYSAYPMVRNTITDMMKAAVFYLAVLIPFSFFMQRLLFSFVRIEAQIASFTTIFVITYFTFHSLHPAFKIAKNPNVVLIAFVMLVLAGFVALALKGKFDYHLESFKDKFATDEGASVTKLIGTALLLGVSNMKRRKLRTALTCITIMLITFTMLSFTSVSQSVAPTRIRKSPTAPYDGIFLCSQIWTGLGRNKVEAFCNTIGHDAKILKRGFISFDPSEAAILSAPGKTSVFPMTGLLCVEQEEDGWLKPFPLKAGRFFSNESAREIIITDSFADKALGLKDRNGNIVIPENYYLELNGVRLKLVGIASSDDLRKMKDLRGSSILPQVTAKQNVFGNQQINPDTLGEQELPEGNFKEVDPQFMVIMPYGIRGTFSIPDTSISVKVDGPQAVWDRIIEYVLYSDDKLYFGLTDKADTNPDRGKNEEAVYESAGTYFMGSGYSTSIGGISSLIIPLLVASTIIFNTMLGAVYERKKEIGIYNAVGLNPIHIALFFVSEAVVYGIVGGVGGYLCGQLLAKLVHALNLMQGLNLNYSSFSVVYVILFTILIVVVSSLYPAIMAMRTARSSSGRRKIEKTDDDHLEVVFPYSFTQQKAVAVNSYIKTFLDKHRDSSVGDFFTENVACKIESQNNGLIEMSVHSKIALVPYDLGITQNVTLRTFFNVEVGAFMVRAEVARISGQTDNWVARNNVFLNSIRKYLLHWRVLSIEGQDSHFAEGLQIFELDSSMF